MLPMYSRRKGGRRTIRKCRTAQAAAWAALGLMLCVSKTARAGEGNEIGYMVFFVDAKDHATKIFNTQRGSVLDGTALSVSFPEQMIGSDGHIWNSRESSPQEFLVTQDGVHKYYVEYEQGEAVKEAPDPEDAQRARLELWVKKAWEAECAVMGRNPEENRNPAVVVGNAAENDKRLRNLISAVQDTGWHYFFLIGKDYTPDTLRIGTDFDAVYSAVQEDVFTLSGCRYEVCRVGVKRRWDPDACAHRWTKISQTPGGCLEYGEENWRCGQCEAEEKTFLPALGHLDGNGDSLCDQCGARAFSQEAGSRIAAVLDTGTGERPLSFTCIDEDYRGTGHMLYLADETLSMESLGVSQEWFESADYNGSFVRQYLNLGFGNSISLSGALLSVLRGDGDGVGDLALLLSEEEAAHYQLMGRIAPAGGRWALRTAAGDGAGMRIVAADGSIETRPADGLGASGCGIRPAVLLEAPKPEEKAEERRWARGDVQMRRIGKETYRFRCVDEDYSDAGDTHKSTALFLCDRVIRSDIDRTDTSLKPLQFGKNNNYKDSYIRAWLNENSRGSDFQTETAYIGVNTAYTGASAEGESWQLSEHSFTGHAIGFQLMQDRMFCLSLEEALRYREELWSFGEKGTDGCKGQISPYSRGYYLRTPFYSEDTSGNFLYTDRIYAVDLEKGNIHPADTDSETYGIRPAFTLPQG